ncbi:MAG: hypothetical protein ACOYK8_10725, partial [Alphaproteobacteria bacterium]
MVYGGNSQRIKNQRGVVGGVPEIIVALAVAGSLMGAMAVLSNKSADDIRVQNAAYQMRQLRDASELFMRQNYQVLSTVGAVQTIPLATLRGQVLPADFPDNNPLNQAYGIRIADSNGAVAGGNLTLLVFTSPAGVDTQLTPEQAAKAASLSGPEGGYIGDNTADWSAGNGGVCAAAGNCAIGSFGGWRVNDLNGTFGVTPGAGGLASTGFISEASMAADVLYRTNIGMPLANTITTTMYGGTAGDLNANGTIDINEVGSNFAGSNGFTFDDTTGNYQFGDPAGGTSGVNITAAGVVDARTRIASPVFDNNGAGLTINSTLAAAPINISATGAGSTINMFADAGTVLSSPAANTPLTIQNGFLGNIWFQNNSIPADIGYDGGGDAIFAIRHTQNVGYTTFQRRNGNDLLRLHNDTGNVDVPNGVLQSRVRTASPIFDNNGATLAINAGNAGANINMFTDSGTVLSSNSGSVLTIRNANGANGSNIYFGGPGDMAWDGGTDDFMAIKHTKNTGATYFVRGDNTAILALDNPSAS